MLEVSDLTMAYPGQDVRVLDAVSFSAGPGVLAVIGPSGSGKTTLLRCLAGSLRPSGGSIRIGGRPIEVPTEHGRGLRLHMSRSQGTAANVAMVYQDYRLVGFLTVKENVSLSRELHGMPEDPSRIAELLERVGIGQLADRYPSTLSGGQAQRAAIARALAVDPQLLLADEPTGALDRTNSDLVAGLFHELGLEGGIPVILATHDPRVAQCAQSVVELTGDGRMHIHRETTA